MRHTPTAAATSTRKEFEDGGRIDGSAVLGPVSSYSNQGGLGGDNCSKGKGSTPLSLHRTRGKAGGVAAVSLSAGGGHNIRNDDRSG
ncbi:unnamed protein product [Linum tenue]|uniref:Uncharacterized protein n=1 Tax=Linum tenue TaxID=586396 RepID=A0AAV0IDC9_9ROSI|nr:unnamed protein product [Linum tenue]